MDSLCIPVGPGEWILGLTQIDKMASIYEGAISSLVLDAEPMATVPYFKYRSIEVPEETESLRLSIETRARVVCSA